MIGKDPKDMIRRTFLFALCIDIVVSLAVPNARAEEQVLAPTLHGEWWQVAGQPDLGDLTGSKQRPVDFAIWQARDKTWQIVSCIRGTRCGGNTRLLHRWESRNLFDESWTPKGVFMQADASLGEVTGGLQAPFVLVHNDLYHMLYGSWDYICLATSPDGRDFSRYVTEAGTTGLFWEGKGVNTRDAQVIEYNGEYYCYYTAHPDRHGAVYCRRSTDLKDWGESTRVAFGGSAGDNPWAAECPFVVHHEQSGWFYLFRTQRYPEVPQTSVYRSKDPLDFGIEDDRYFLCRLPVAAPEIFTHEGQDYIAALMPHLDGIRICRLQWIESPEKTP